MSLSGCHQRICATCSWSWMISMTMKCCFSISRMAYFIPGVNLSPEWHRSPRCTNSSPLNAKCRLTWTVMIVQAPPDTIIMVRIFRVSDDRQDLQMMIFISNSIPWSGLWRFIWRAIRPMDYSSFWIFPGQCIMSPLQGIALTWSPLPILPLRNQEISRKLWALLSIKTLPHTLPPANAQ